MRPATVLPAGAGVIPKAASTVIGANSFTRRRGGDPPDGRTAEGKVKFYPQARG